MLPVQLYGVYKNPGVAGFVVQAALLPVHGIGDATGHQRQGCQCAQHHVGQRTDQAAQHEAGDQRADAPIDEFPLEAAKLQGFLQSLVYRVAFRGHTPKNALITTETNTRNRQEPPHDMSSLLMSLSPLFHLMYTRIPPIRPTTAPMARMSVDTGSTYEVSDEVAALMPLVPPWANAEWMPS